MPKRSSSSKSRSSAKGRSSAKSRSSAKRRSSEKNRYSPVGHGSEERRSSGKSRPSTKRRASSQRDAPPKRRPKRRRRDEPAPVLAGRLLIAGGLLLAMWLFPFPLSSVFGDVGTGEEEKINMDAWAAGNPETVKITLITADYDRLGCVLDRKIEGSHCEYKTETERWPLPEGAPLDNNKKDVIQPYSTSPHNQLILVSGLWAQPEVAQRLHDEPAHAIPEKKLSRFLAECKVRPLERINQIKLRWSKEAKWGNQGPAWVARAESCKVLEID